MMDTIHHVLAVVPPSAQLALAGLGALWVGSRVFSLLRLVLSMFVLSGTNVGKPGGSTLLYLLL